MKVDFSTLVTGMVWMVFKKITKERRRKRSWERKGGEGKRKKKN